MYERQKAKLKELFDRDSHFGNESELWQELKKHKY